MNENNSTIVLVYEIIKSDFHKIDSETDKCIKGCQNKNFHTIDYKCVYDIKLTNFVNNEVVNITLADVSMIFFELNKNLKVARQKGFIFAQVKKLTIKLYSSLPKINISYNLKFRKPRCHRQFEFFRILSQNREYIENLCKNIKNPFQFACFKWYLDNQSP